MPDALLAAIANGEEVTVEDLLASGASLDAPGLDGSTNALLCAANVGRIDLVRALVEHGADVNYADRRGLTALHDAASSGNTELAKTLIGLGASIDREALDGLTPLHLAAAWGATDVARLLLNAGAQRDHRDARGWDAIRFAEEKEQDEILHLLASGRTPSADDLSADKSSESVPRVFPVDETLGSGAYRIAAVQPQGISLNIDPKNKNVAPRGAHRVTAVPEGLQIIRDGETGHFVIAPIRPMRLEEYAALCARVQLDPELTLD